MFRSFDSSISCVRAMFGDAGVFGVLSGVVSASVADLLLSCPSCTGGLILSLSHILSCEWWALVRRQRWWWVFECRRTEMCAAIATKCNLEGAET